MYGNDCTTDQVEKHVLWRHVPQIKLQGGGGVQVRRGKNPRQGESLDRDKD